VSDGKEQAIWQSLALDGVGDLIGSPRPGLVIGADATTLLFANAAGRRSLGSHTFGGPVGLDRRLADRLAHFAATARPGETVRELVRTFEGLRPRLLDVEFHRIGETDPVFVVRLDPPTTETSAEETTAGLAPLAGPDGLAVIFDADGEIAGVAGDHGILDGLHGDIEALFDLDDRPVIERRLGGPERPRDVVLVRLGSDADPRRLLRVAPAPRTPKARPRLDGLFAPTPEPPPPAEPVAPQATPVAATAAEPAPSIPVDAEPIDTPEPAAPPMPPTAAVEPTPAAEAAIEPPIDAPAEEPPAAPAAAEATAEPVALVTEAESPAIEIIEAAPVAETAPAETETAATVAEPPEATETVDEEPVIAERVVEPTEAERTEAAAAAPESPAPTDAFVFAPLERPVKFVWQMDADHRFTLVSEELAGTVGPAAAAIVGSTWTEIAERFSLDDDGRVAAALARRDTWSGRTVPWPIEGEALRLPIDLAALPVFDRGRVFVGFRGFGTCRAEETVPDPTAVGRRLMPSRTAPAEPVATTDEPAADTPASATTAPAAVAIPLVEDLPETTAETGPAEVPSAPATPAPSEPDHTTAPVADTPTDTAPAAPTAAAPRGTAEAAQELGLLAGLGPGEIARLSQIERNAFRQIAETLGARVETESASAEVPPPAAEPAPRPARRSSEGRSVADARLLDRLPVAVAIVKDDDVVYANERFLTSTGYPDLATFRAEGGLDGLFAGAHAARRFETDDDGRPVPLLTRDGTVVPVDAMIATVPWGDGSALMMTVTEYRTAEPAATAIAPLATEEAVSRNRIAELEAILDTATDGVLVLDAEGMVLSANQGAEVLFGAERSEMIGRPLTERLAPESRRSVADYLDGLARNGVASVLNDGREVIGLVRPEGLIPLFLTIGRISTGGGARWCAVLRDITQWKKAEEDLTAARRRAEEASVHKSDFLAKISHEIRTPLNAIIGFSEVMMDERFGPIGNDRYKDYLRDIHVSGTHIMSLVNDLLDLSKVEAGKMDLRFEAVMLADMVSECVAIMQPQANRNRIIIRSSLPAGVPAVVADPRSIRQVLLNLLSNAVKFTPAGGQVIVSTSLEDNGEVVLRVRDTGYGMTDKELETAMEPFRQLHTTRTRAGGTGLGLPLTKALAEANRASFRIDSTVGQGTLVTVAFPVTRVLAG
jgi:PAS domain S-box-containing protein